MGNKEVPIAEMINIPQPNDGAFSSMIEGVSCRSYVRYHEGQNPALGTERTNYTVGVEVWGSYGPLIGLVMLEENPAVAVHQGPWYSARYQKQVAPQFFPDVVQAVRWVMEQRKNDPDRTDNGLRDTREG